MKARLAIIIAIVVAFVWTAYHEANKPATTVKADSTIITGTSNQPTTAKIATNTNNPTTTDSTIDTNRLAQAILDALTQYSPVFDATNLDLAGWKGYIAHYIATKASNGATNFDSLNANFRTIFSSDANLNWLDWKSNTTLLTIAAFVIAAKEYTPGRRDFKMPRLSKEDTSSNSWGNVLLWTGAKLENSYTINPSTQTLQSGGSSSQPYIEIGFNTSYVIRSGSANDENWVGNWFGQGETLNDGHPHLLYPLQKIPDIAGSFGYILPSNTTNLSASTIVGTGDIYASGSVGFPIIRLCSEDYSCKQQATIDVAWGFTTDKNFLSIHPSLFLGGGYEGKFPNFISSTNFPIYWFGRLGAAEIDMPKLSGASVKFNNNGGLSEPEFDQRWVPSMGTSIIFPVTSVLSLQAGGNAYFSEHPGNWDVTLGVTLDLSKFVTALGFKQ